MDVTSTDIMDVLVVQTILVLIGMHMSVYTKSVVNMAATVHCAYITAHYLALML